MRNNSGSDQHGSHLLDDLHNRFALGLESTFTSLIRAEFDAVVALLADTRRPVWVTGGRFTQSGAELLQPHLYQLRPRTHAIAYTPFGRDDALLDISRRDVVVVFDLRRYQKDTIALAEAARKRGTSIVLVTDPWLSPIASLADRVLAVDVDAPSPYDSMVPLMALIEALVAGVVERLGESGRRRVAVLERLRNDYTWDK